MNIMNKGIVTEKVAFIEAFNSGAIEAYIKNEPIQISFINNGGWSDYDVSENVIPPFENKMIHWRKKPAVKKVPIDHKKLPLECWVKSSSLTDNVFKVIAWGYVPPLGLYAFEISGKGSITIKEAFENGWLWSYGSKDVLGNLIWNSFGVDETK